MSVLSREDLKHLIHERAECCVSLFMPTHRSGPEIRQDPIRLRNLIRQAEAKLVEGGMRSVEARDRLSPAVALVDDSDFWRHQGDGLAIFLSPASFHHYCLPVGFQELLVVTNGFHLKPLLPLFAHDSHFYILALSQNEVRFFRGTHHGIDPVELPSAPGSLADTLGLFDPEKQGEIYSGTAILQFCHSINEEVRKYLATDRAPLVLAGVESLLQVYRQANTYPSLMDEGIHGNPESLKPDELCAQGQAIARKVFLGALEATIERYKRNVSTERTSRDIENILRAAERGKVDSLIVAIGLQRWGILGSATDAIQLHETPEPDDEDLLNRAAMMTLANGGEVYAVKPEEVPDGSPMAAIFRY